MMPFCENEFLGLFAALRFLRDDLPVIFAGYQAQVASVIPLNMSSIQTIDESNGTFSSGSESGI